MEIEEELPAWSAGFRVPPNLRAKGGGEVHRWDADGNVRFTPEMAEVGLFPFWYRHDSQTRIPPHQHHFFELVLVLDGEGFNAVAGHRHPIRAGDALFIDHVRPHALEVASGHMDVFNLCFLPSTLGLDNELLSNFNLIDFYDFLRPFKKSAGEDDPGKLSPEAPTFSRWRFYALHMAELFAEDPRGNLDLMRHQARLLLFLLLKEYRKRHGSEAAAGGAMLEVARYLQEHASEKITLEELADRIGMSRSYFSTVFNRTFGKTLREALIELRVRRAKEILRQTDLPMARVAA
ncbi:MAG: AraC family transcriptional regulator, partial [Spirochaetes bacterium]|nr:AraC family transcriptional regulator [Spirochaetota bacterium]